MRLLIKKPDMIGRSQWEFVDRGHVIRARMKDFDWVKQYQQNDFSLNPGDAIDAKVRVTPKGAPSDGEYSYDIMRVHRVIESSIAQQSHLFDDSTRDGGME
jgi:hypothetical protein